MLKVKGVSWGQNMSWAAWLHSWRKCRLLQHKGPPEMVASWSRVPLRETLTVPRWQPQEQVSAALLCKADGHITLYWKLTLQGCTPWRLQLNAVFCTTSLIRPRVYTYCLKEIIGFP